MMISTEQARRTAATLPATTGSILYRFAQKALHEELSQLVHEARPSSILEVGYGPVLLSSFLVTQDPTLAWEGSDEALQAPAYADQHVVEQVIFRNSSFDLPGRVFDLVICSRVLEQAVRPERLIGELKSHARRHMILVAACEPYFTWYLRLAHLLHDPEVPAPLQHWNSTAFRAFVCKQFSETTFRYRHVYQFALCRMGRSNHG